MGPRVFIYVIASFGDPVYIELIKLRKLQLSKYNIPHYFLFDEDMPVDYTMDKNDIYLKKEDIMSHADVNPHMNPFMIQRFLKGLQLIDETSYDYIIRVNISTFINIDALLNELEEKPRSQFAMAHIIYQRLSDWKEYSTKDLRLFSGTCLIISKDVASYLKTINIYSDILHKHNDDTVISHILNQYIKEYSNIDLCFLETNICCDEPSLKKFFMFRIKNNMDRNYDILHWIFLLRQIDNIEV